MNLFFSQCTRCTFHDSSVRSLPAWSSLTASFIWASKSSMTSSILSKPGGSFFPRRRRRKDIGVRCGGGMCGSPKRASRLARVWQRA